jgi:hypothetical protein
VWRARSAAAGATVVSVADSPGNDLAARDALEEGIRELIIALQSNPEHPDCRISLRSQCVDLAKWTAQHGDVELALRVANTLADSLPNSSVGPVYAAFLLARFATVFGKADTTSLCSDRAFAFLTERPSAELASLHKLLADPVLDVFRNEVRFSKLLPRR